MTNVIPLQATLIQSQGRLEADSRWSALVASRAAVDANVVGADADVVGAAVDVDVVVVHGTVEIEGACAVGGAAYPEPWPEVAAVDRIHGDPRVGIPATKERVAPPCEDDRALERVAGVEDVRG
eukprot:Opistho-2@40609